MINTTQLVVRTDKTTIEWLEAHGYTNPHNLPNEYTFPVFIVDILHKETFGTNTTCMATACSCVNRPIVLDFEQLRQKLLNCGND